MPYAFEEVRVTVEKGIAVATLNRPGRYNALGALIVDELNEMVGELEKDSEARALILTGAGDRAFCSGVDLKERREMDADGRWAHNRALNEFAERLAKLQIPTIAAINSLALGGGFEITLSCDFRVAAEHTEVGLPEVGIGIIPGAGGTQRLPRLIGPTRAKDLILTARRIGAKEALEMGILSQVVSTSQLMDTALQVAGATAQNSPLALAYAKASIDVGIETSLEQGLRFETAAIRTTLASDDYLEGLAAFAEKRPPEFPPLTARNVT